MILVYSRASALLRRCRVVCTRKWNESSRSTWQWQTRIGRGTVRTLKLVASGTVVAPSTARYTAIVLLTALAAASAADAEWTSRALHSNCSALTTVQETQLLTPRRQNSCHCQRLLTNGSTGAHCISTARCCIRDGRMLQRGLGFIRASGG